VFYVLVITAKRSVDELFSQTVVRYCGFRPKPSPEFHSCTLLGDFRSQTSNLPTDGKNPAGAWVAAFRRIQSKCVGVVWALALFCVHQLKPTNSRN